MAAKKAFGIDHDVSSSPILTNVPLLSSSAKYTIFSHLKHAHSSGGGILGFMTMADSGKLRVQNREAREAIMNFEWYEFKSKWLNSSVQMFREAFPKSKVFPFGMF
jgi:hypothetical protein